MDEVDLEFIHDMHRFSETAVRLPGTREVPDPVRGERTGFAVRHALQIVGEAASRISRNGRLELPDIPWSKVIGMRHHLVHGYLELRVEILVQAVREDLPDLIAQLRAAVKDAGP